MSNLLTTIETDLASAWGNLEKVAEADALAIWGDFKGILTALLPEQYTILYGFVVKILPEVVTGDIADVETALLNLVEVQELAWVKELGSKVLQAIIAVIQASVTKTAA